MNNKMVDQATNLKLVAEIEKRPCLYNYTLTSYSRKDLTEKAWSEIGQKINLPGNECKERWKNIRAVFTRHMKPTQGNLRKYKKRYYLAEAMQFAIPFMKGLKCSNKNNSEKPSTQAENNEQAEDIKIENPLTINDSGRSDSVACSSVEYITCSTGSPVPSQSPHSEPSLSPQLSSLTSPLPSHRSKQMKRTNKHRDQDDLAQIYADLIAAKKNQCNVDSESLEAANRMFLLSLLPDMNQMTLSQIRQFKRKIIEIIEEIFKDKSNEAKYPDASSSSICPTNTIALNLEPNDAQINIKEEIIP